VPNEQQHFDIARQWQAEFDKTLEDPGARAPAPVLGQKANDYVREQMRVMKKTYLPQNHDVYRVNMRGLPADAIIPTWETMLKPAIQKEAYNPAHVPKGEMREIKRKNINGQTVSQFIGHLDDRGNEVSFIKQHGRPGRRVWGFLWRP
jgi:hypothetical protein